MAEAEKSSAAAICERRERLNQLKPEEFGSEQRSPLFLGADWNFDLQAKERPLFCGASRRVPLVFASNVANYKKLPQALPRRGVWHESSDSRVRKIAHESCVCDTLPPKCSVNILTQRVEWQSDSPPPKVRSLGGTRLRGYNLLSAETGTHNQ